jgi:hypothetical protein
MVFYRAPYKLKIFFRKFQPGKKWGQKEKMGSKLE